MSDYGVKRSGFVRKRLPEQLNEIRDSLKNGLGSNIDLTPDTVLGVISHISAERFASIWELAEAVYGTMYPMSATGSNLDKAVSFIGVTRLQELPSSCAVTWFGKNGTVIPNYSCVRNKRSQVKYFALGDVTISQDNAHCVTISPSVSSIEINGILSVVINGVTYSYQTDRASIKYAMEKLFAKLAGLKFADVKLNNLDLTVTASSVTGFSVAVNNKLSISKLGTLGRVTTDKAETDLAEAGDISEIIDLVDGLDEVNNFSFGTAGRQEETDSELYQRYHKGVWHTGAGTAESIQANLLKVEGVNHAVVYENKSNTLNDFGMPAHSLYCVVKGGLDANIAQVILKYAPAGITLHGSSTVTAKDSQKINQIIKFGRPRKVYIWVNVIVNTFVDQGEFAATGYSTKIIENIMNYAATLNVGDDVILQRIIGKCVDVKGVGKVQVTIGRAATLDSAGPSLNGNNITIAPDEEAIFDRTIIKVT